MRDHRCGVTGWITGPDFCQGSRALVRSLQADGKYCHVFDSQHYFHREQSRVMKSLCWSETGDDGGRFRPLKERKRGRVNGSARFGFCAQVLHLTQIKEPFQLLKKHVLPLIAWTAVTIKHMVLRRWAFVPAKLFRYKLAFLLGY